MLQKDQTVFVLVDVQGKLAEIVHDSEHVLDNLTKLIQGLRVLDVPIIWLEQYPEGLGPTADKISAELQGLKPIPKMTFSACGNLDFMRALNATGRKQVLIAGIETHVCVYQTARRLHELEYDVNLVQDATSSRTESNRDIGIQTMQQAGIKGTSVEMALYELMEKAGTDTFKQVLKIIK
ncbi:5'-nucleotidase [Lentibacillus sp. JNUCC-1]|uniref:hydrolase n=1 Tax=Lentibacillus sp. JNUCC-1 TaxID=2654513 RepID=UPI0012E84E45|nr:hydrolase [Lentibacillus sp. JNUCC-1]MUV38900.1 5'-nucleotidase [Lentibacillus sp. JNUCC-1]